MGTRPARRMSEKSWLYNRPRLLQYQVCSCRFKHRDMVFLFLFCEGGGVTVPSEIPQLPLPLKQCAAACKLMTPENLSRPEHLTD